jgi:hypothetical protein
MNVKKEAGDRVSYETTCKILKVYFETGSVLSLDEEKKSSKGLTIEKENFMTAQLLVDPDSSYRKIQNQMSKIV